MMSVNKRANRDGVVVGMVPECEPQCVVAGEAAFVQRLAELQIQYLGVLQKSKAQETTNRTSRTAGRRWGIGLVATRP